MGTKVQCKTYLPGFCSTRDLNDNRSNTSWLLKHENMSTKNSQHTDSVSSQLPLDGCFEYDREKVRRTILDHESIFRHQLQELHRLYRRQRDLVNECQRKEVHNNRTKTFQSSPSLSHVPPQDVKKTWQESHFPSLDSIAGQLSTSDAAKIQYPFYSVEDDSRYNHFSSKDTRSSKDCESLKSGTGLLQRKMFDSKFVVDQRMNNKDEHPTRKLWGYPADGTYEISQSRDAKTFNASASEFHSGADPDRLNSSTRTNELADLNEPLPLEETPPLVPDINISSVTCLVDDMYDGRKFSQKSLGERVGGIFLNHPPGRNGEEQLPFHLSAEKRKLDNQSSVSGVRKKTIFGVEICEENHIKVASCSNVHTSTHKSQPCSQSYTELLKDVEAYQGKVHTSGHVRSLSSSKDISYQNGFSKSSQLNATEIHDCSVVGCDLASGMTACNLAKFCSKRDRTSNCSGVGDMDFKSAMMFKIGKETSSTSRTEVAEEAFVSKNCQRRHENSLETLPWLVGKLQHSVEHTKGRENCHHLNLDSLQNYSKQFFSREETAVNSSQILNHNPGTLPLRSTKVSECQKIEVSDNTKIRKIFGVPIFSASKDSHAAGVLSKNSSPDVDGDTATKISGDETIFRSQVEAKDFVREKGLNGYISGLRHQIDLNLSLDEEEAPSTPPLPEAVLKIATTEIDLEASAVLDCEPECGNSKLSSEEFNESNEEVMRLAAESIISMSISGANRVLDDSTTQSLQSGPSGCLKWFAELVSSQCTGRDCIIESEFDEESIPDGIDYFEIMTLKQEVMKEEEYFYKMPTLENHNDEEIGTTTISKRPRRGQARRGRQRNNFQRDVLPGIISLSKYEVTEDILTFEELLKASGCSWQSSLSQRKTGKSGRGRRRSGGAAPSPTIRVDCPPPVIQPCYSEPGLEEKSLTGWGKRTRRLPRQRCQNANLSFPLKQC